MKSKLIPIRLVGTSMLPLFAPGAILMTNTSSQTPTIESIMIIKKKHAWFAHRVVRINQKNKLIETRGDNAPFSDGWTFFSTIVGMVEIVICHGTPIYVKKLPVVIIGIIISTVSRFMFHWRITTAIYEYVIHRSRFHRALHILLSL